jgi:hypothetical protein
MLHIPSYRYHILGDNIMASETIAIASPTIALIPCVIHAIYVYLQKDLTFTHCDIHGPPSYLPIVQIGGFNIYAPFSTTTNICYVMAGIVIYMYSIPNRAFMHNLMYGIGMLFVILGGGSAAFHANGSLISSWQHAVDIFGIYVLFTSLCGAAFLGMYQSFKGSPLVAASKDPVPLIINVATIVGVFCCVIFWQSIDQTKLLVATGIVIVISNATTQAIYAIRANELLPLPTNSTSTIRSNSTIRYICSGFLAFAVSALPRVAVLACALYINLQGRLLPAKLQLTCYDAINNELEISYRIEMLKRWDFVHGVWHYLSSTVLTAMALSSQQGLDGTPMTHQGITNTKVPFGRFLFPVALKTDEYVEELLSRVVISIFSIICAALYGSNISSDGWQVFLMISSFTYLPIWSIFAYWSILKIRHL